ncbi:LysM peptidoglycan-binding domain-containing protein [Glutamicibacter sp.]|uniref:LysM peptidoglycan-binding domain-containing protein n=1 Tax=Glutamicibacter sp. TaxID=1931995 RepID=UPI0028BF102A|nr:LysM peptidoglycan-binding domain-containing protein [Glutamicibacter sp.]
MPNEAKYASKHTLGVVAGAAIPAAVIGSLALAPAAQAAPASAVSLPGSSAKSITPQNIKIAEDQIKAHLIASRVSTLGLPAKASVKEIKIPAGATLSALAVKYDTTVGKLKDLNNLKNDFIVAGKSLKVPGQGSSKSSSSSKSSKSSKGSGTGNYTVKSGDTLSGIANKHDMSLSSLLEMNDISASKTIYPGNKLKVKGGSSSNSGSKNTSHRSSSSSSSNYTVKAGDTLSGIAAKHNMSLQALLSKNNISSSKIIRPGDKIKVNGGSNDSSKSSSKSSAPKASSSSASYTVKSGDTLSGIAAKHGMKLSELLSINGISASKKIFPGDKVKVSGSGSSTKSSSSAPKSSAPKTSTYTVKSGDTLGGISTSHNMKLAALLDLNPSISTETPLKIGTKLKVRGSSVSSTSSSSKPRKVPNSFLGRTYEDHVVDNANNNKDYLDSISVPSRSEMQSIIVAQANRMGVDPALALAHGMQESGFNMRAVSPANAIGAMQVIPSTGEWISGRVGKKLNLMDPRDNALAGVAVIRYNLDNTDNLDDAIASYYQGLGGVQKYGMYDDTKKYVASVKSLMKQFR